MNTQTIHISIIIFFISSISYCYNSQIDSSKQKSSDDNNFRVEYIRSISSTADIEKDKGIGEEIIDWIFGSDFLTLVKPVGMIKNNSEIIVLDQGRRELVKIDTAEEDFYVVDFDDDRGFPSLLDICKLSKDEYLFTDSKNNTIYLFNTEDEEISKFNTSLALKQPTGIALNTKTKEIWVIETKNHSIAVFDFEGKFVRRIGIRGTKEGKFNFPTYLSIDANGIVYVVDSMNFRVQIFNSEGKVLNVFGEIGNASGYFARPKGIAVDSYGHIFVVDALYNSIQVFSSKGQLLYYFGSPGSSTGEFWLPAGIFIDEKNIIYVADSYNSRIQIFKLVKND